MKPDQLYLHIIFGAKWSIEFAPLFRSDSCETVQRIVRGLVNPQVVCKNTTGVAGTILRAVAWSTSRRVRLDGQSLLKSIQTHRQVSGDGVYDVIQYIVLDLLI